MKNKNLAPILKSNIDHIAIISLRSNKIYSFDIDFWAFFFAIEMYIDVFPSYNSQ